MSKVKIELNSEGIRELLRSEAVANECKKYAAAIADRAGEGYTISSRNYPKRSGYAVYAGTPQAHVDNLRNNTLLKELHA